MELEGQTAVVTGAARGIGQAIAIALAREGARVVVSDVVDVAETTRAIDRDGGMSHPALADVTSLADMDRLMAKTRERFGSLDLVVANAAYSLRGVYFEQPYEDAKKTVDVTMWGTYHTLRSAGRAMVDSGTRGCILVVGSPHADAAVPRCMAYNMAKAAVEQMARTAATELVSNGIRVNIIRPGWTDTPGERRYFTEDDLQTKGRELPMGRLARPEEVARVAVFLASPRSEYITGSTYSVDGGIALEREE